MKKEEAISYLQQLYPNGGHCWLDEQRIEAIGMAIKALQEEPASKDKFTFTSLPRLLDRIKPTDRAKWYSSRLADALEKEGYITDAKIVRESIKLMNGEKVPMATMDEETVSEDLGDYINELSKQFPEVSFAKLSRIAVRVAKWQKEQDQSTIELAEDHAYFAGRVKTVDEVKEKLISEVLPCFMHGGEADEVTAKLDEVLNQKK